MDEIIYKKPISRTHEERSHLAGFLQFGTPFFKDTKRMLIEQLCDKIEAR